MQAAPLHSVVPTPYDELCFAHAAYQRHTAMDSTLLSRGFRVYDEQDIHPQGLRIIMYAPSWFPQPFNANFPYDHIMSPQLNVGFIFRGTQGDLVGNALADLELVYNKFVDGQALPTVTEEAVSFVKASLTTLLEQHPQLRKAGKQLRVHCSGHSLGGFLAESVTVRCDELASSLELEWVCTTFESTGLPGELIREAEQRAPRSHWEERITGYLAAPNPINMLYSHLGRIVHVQVPFEQRWTHIARCIAADSARLAGLLAVVRLADGQAKQARSDNDEGQEEQEGPNWVQGLVATSALVATTQPAITSLAMSVATVLGVEVEELVDQHKVDHMYQCFERHPPGNLKKKYRRDMDTWPLIKTGWTGLLDGTLQAFQSMLPSFICTANMGIWNMWNRNAMIMRRCQKMPGYTTSKDALVIGHTEPRALEAAVIIVPAGQQQQHQQQREEDIQPDEQGAHNAGMAAIHGSMAAQLPMPPSSSEHRPPTSPQAVRVGSKRRLPLAAGSTQP